MPTSSENVCFRKYFGSPISGSSGPFLTRLGHGRLSQFFDVWWLIAGGSVAQRPFGTAPLIGVKDPCRISLHTETGARGGSHARRFDFVFSRRDCRIGLCSCAILGGFPVPITVALHRCAVRLRSRLLYCIAASSGRAPKVCNAGSHASGSSIQRSDCCAP